MGAGTVTAFWAVSILLVLTPGADWAYAIAAGLRHRSVVPAIGGLIAGYLLHTAVVAAGVAAVVARSPRVLTVLTTVGATYLVALGVAALAHPAEPRAGTAHSNTSWIRQAARGAGISGLNPKALLLFLALLPQFTDDRFSWPIGLQLVALGLIHTINSTLVYSGVAVGAQTVLRTRPAAANAVTRLAGAAMVLIGAVLFVEQVWVK